MDPQELAKHLKKPEGEFGIQVSQMMHKGNAGFYLRLPQLLQLEGNEAVLEVGMGAGLHFSVFSDLLPRGELVGVDYSPSMVAEAARNSTALSNVSVVLGDATDLPFMPERFDIVFTINTVYFYRLLDAFNQYHRVLKNKGVLVIGKRTKEDLLNLGAVTQHGFNRVDTQEVISAAETAGFRFIDQKCFEDQPAEIGNEVIQLHSEFLIFQKPTC